MKKILLLVFSSSFLFSKCNQTKQEKKIYIKSEKKSTEDQDNLYKTDTISIKNSTANKSHLEKSPIKIIKATLLNNNYSHHKDIKVIYKNSSKKAIKAIKFEWFCINAFEEPASGNYFYGEGKFKGKTTDLIKPGEIKTEIWEDFSTDADKIIKIRAYYVVFNNGTKWQLNKDDVSL